MSTVVNASALEAEFARAILAASRNVTPAAQETACRHIIDFAGVALAGSVHPRVRLAAGALAGPLSGGTAGGRLIGSGERTELDTAVMLNAMAGHIHDFDDDEVLLSIAHTTVPVMAAAWTLADALGASGRQVVAAYICGVETMMRLGQIVNPRHYRDGWHSSATLGVFGAAVAAAILQGLDEEALLHALRFATSMSAGIRASFGSDGKALQLGLAARNGIVAARVARAGLRCSAGTLFGEQGYAAMYGGSAQDPAAAIRAFGAPSGLLEPGLTIKRYPCCTATHTAVDAVLGLMHEHAIDADGIAALEVEVGVDLPPILIYDRPRSGLEGKFSMKYCVAAAARYGRLGIAEFEDDRVAEAGVQAFMDRVDIRVDHATPRPAVGLADHAKVTLRLADGNVLQRQYAHPSGSRQRPFTADQLQEKFLACATDCLPRAQARDTWTRLLALPATADFRTIAQACLAA
ncbi:MmgE/PrpD family protein [Achromobacter aloeverae]